MNQVTLGAVLLLGLLLAAMIGNAVGVSDMRFVAGAIALIPVVIIFVRLKTNIWILMPIGWYLTGRLPWLPLPFSVRDMCFLITISFFILFVAMRVIPMKRKIGMLEYLIYINLAYLAVVYARNPVGFWAFQSEMVGGRPYFEVIQMTFAFAILSRIKITDFTARIFPLFFVIPTWIIGILSVTAQFVPQLAYPLAMLYTGVGSMFSEPSGPEAEIGETRLAELMFAGQSSILALCAKYNPITLISPFYPLRILGLLAAIGAIFLSGFRSTLLFAFAALAISSLLRRRLQDMWIAGGAFVLSLVIIISLQGSVLQFPRTMQRSLSWLPGDWDADAVASAEDSSRWRFEMWGWAWNDDRILRDRVWGQGFGFSLDDMNLIVESKIAGQGGSSNLGGSDREEFMIVGAFHSGPLSAIKYIGIVGLCLYYPLLCYMALLAWHLCRRAYGTKAFGLALFVGIPIIYEPFNFIFIFGGLDGNFSQMLFWAGLLNMTKNYLNTVQTKTINIA